MIYAKRALNFRAIYVEHYLNFRAVSTISKFNFRVMFLRVYLNFRAKFGKKKKTSDLNFHAISFTGGRKTT